MTNNMRKGWEIKKLGEVCKITSSKRIFKHEYTNDGVPFYRTKEIKELSNNKPISLELFISKDKYLDIKHNFGVPKIGDLLMSAVGTIGEILVIENEEEFYFKDGNILWIKDLNQIQSLYLKYVLTAFVEEIKQLSIGSAYSALTIEKLDKYEISYPKSLAEQQRIVSILDEAFGLIEKAKLKIEKNLQNAKELFQSEMNAIFENGKLKIEKGEWEEKTLKEVSFEFGRGKSKHRPRNDEKLYGGNYPFIQTGDVRNADKFITQYSQTYNDIGLAQSKLWKKGTICITIAANIAETGILTFDSCFPDSMIGLVIDPKKAEVNFAYYALQFLKTALQLLGKGSAQDNLNMGTFENQKFPFPNLETQQKIVHQLDNLSAETKRLEAMYQQKLDALEELKKSILQKAFSGELKIES